MDTIFEPIATLGKPPVYNYFDGKTWKVSTSGKTVSVVSPVDGEVVGQIQIVTHEEIDEVLLQAKNAQTKWELTPLHQRIKIMHLSADWIRHHEEYLTTLLQREVGKTTADAKSEIVRTADLIDYIADEALSLRGETLDSDNFPGFEKGRTAIVERVSHGVVLCIAPFNYPVNLAASKIVPALLMGNSVIYKPPTQGSISGLHLVQILVKAGMPEGVLSCLTGGGDEIGDYLSVHPNISMIAFTGSSEVGVHIATKAAMIPLLFECGGNNPALVLPDADLDLAAKEIIKGGFSFSGQRCTAIKYVICLGETYELLMGAITTNMKSMVMMGDPRSPETKLVGPVISQKAAQNVQTTIDEAVGAGAKIVTGGKTNNLYVEPTLLSNVTPSMNVVAHETFGPVISFITVKTVDEGVQMINASAYGLQACVFTKDEGSGLVVAKRLNVGTVQINGSPQRGPDHFPFMGVKKSGLGVQGVRYSLEAMSRLKSTVINKPA